MILFHEPSWQKVYFGMALGAVGLIGMAAARFSNIKFARSSHFDPNGFQLEKTAYTDEEDEDYEPLKPRVAWYVRFRKPIRIVSIATVLFGIIYSIVAYRAISNAEEAARLVNKRDLVGAVVAYKKALGSLPDSPGIRYQLAKALTALHRYDEALPEFARSVHDDDTVSEAHVDYGNALLASGHTSDAIVEYVKALALSPDNLVGYINLGNAYVKAGRYEDAYKQYRLVIDRDPKNIVAHVNLGNALRAGGHKEEGIQESREALRLAPTDAILHNNLGNALYSGGKRDQAIEEYRKAAELKPDYPASYFNLANAIVNPKEDQSIAYSERREAITALESFLRLAQDHPEYGPGVPKAYEYLKKLKGS